MSANGSGQAEIRRAYLALARQHHPDAHTRDGPAARARAEARMREINDAWALLSDPERRRRYDATLDPYDAGPMVGGARTVPSDAWHPRQDDTGWMDDFEAWRQEADDAVPPDPPSAARSTLTIFPVGLFLVSVATGCLAMVLQSRPLLAASFVGVAVAALIFLLLPMLVMAQRPKRRRCAMSAAATYLDAILEDHRGQAAADRRPIEDARAVGAGHGPGAGVRRRAAGRDRPRRDQRGEAALAVQGDAGPRPRPGRARRAVRGGRRHVPVGPHRRALVRRLGRRPGRRPAPRSGCRCCARTSPWARTTCATRG